jgi:SAM-dependent methyltransferase
MLRDMLRRARRIAGGRSDPGRHFHSNDYLRHNARRLEHLASLGIPVRGRSVLDVGAGIGDHSHYYVDRGCRVTIVEARGDHLEILRRRYPGERIHRLDMERPTPVEGAPFDVVHCYGLLYHLRAPEQGLRFLSSQCGGMLLLETCVSFGSERAINLVEEDDTNPTQSAYGTGCRPTRPWIFALLKELFEHVYAPATQPNHEEFPVDWTSAPTDQRLSRAVFIASRHPLINARLLADLPDHQQRHD